MTHSDQPGAAGATDEHQPAFFDRSGARISLERYIKLRADLAYRTVARDRVGDEEVITMWLGTDQGWDQSAPLIFGTIVFDHAGGTFREDTERFTGTEDAARRVHEANVADRNAKRAAVAPA